MNANDRLRELLKEHWVLSLATRDPDDPEAAPYSTPLFYALHWLPDGLHPGAPVLVFAGKPTTTHGRHLGRGPTRVSAAVALETETVGKIRGAQLRGLVIQAGSLEPATAKSLYRSYVQRHPVAVAMLAAAPEEKLYALLVEWVKLTDNRFGIGVRKELEFPVEPGELPVRS